MGENMKKIFLLLITVFVLLFSCAYDFADEAKMKSQILKHFRDIKNGTQSKKFKVLIDAGHQRKGNNEKESVGPGSGETKAKVSSGTVGVATGKNEYVLNLEVALKLQKKLQDNNYEVIMVRETHDVNISNKERATMANDANVDMVIRIHADGSENSSVSGYSVLIPGSDYIKDKQLLSNSRKFAEITDAQLKKLTGQKSRGVIVRNDLTGFNWLKVPGILIEMGYMSNANEDKLMSDSNHQDKIVNAIFNALEEYRK